MEIAKNAQKSKPRTRTSSVGGGNYCYDCGKEIKIQGKEIRNGVLLEYENGSEKFTTSKCNECFAKSQELKNYQPCEVYSRIVGYLRPVQQWNLGKNRNLKKEKNINYIN
jgi:hypothetical protein